LFAKYLKNKNLESLSITASALFNRVMGYTVPFKISEILIIFHFNVNNTCEKLFFHTRLLVRTPLCVVRIAFCTCTFYLQGKQRI